MPEYPPRPPPTPPSSPLPPILGGDRRQSLADVDHGHAMEMHETVREPLWSPPCMLFIHSAGHQAAEMGDLKRCSATNMMPPSHSLQPCGNWAIDSSRLGLVRAWAANSVPGAALYCTVCITIQVQAARAHGSPPNARRCFLIGYHNKYSTVSALLPGAQSPAKAAASSSPLAPVVPLRRQYLGSPQPYIHDDAWFCQAVSALGCVLTDVFYSIFHPSHGPAPFLYRRFYRSVCTMYISLVPGLLAYVSGASRRP